MSLSFFSPVFANAWTFLFNRLCGFGPLLFLGTFVGLATAWCWWYRSGQQRAYAAKLEETRLREGILALMAAAPLLGRSKAGVAELRDIRAKLETVEGELDGVRYQLVAKDRELLAKVAEFTKRTSTSDVQQSQIQTLQGKVSSTEET